MLLRPYNINIIILVFSLPLQVLTLISEDFVKCLLACAFGYKVFSVNQKENYLVISGMLCVERYSKTNQLEEELTASSIILAQLYC